MATKDVSVVLAHGAWADGSSWARVITGLTAHGLKASAVPMPLTSLADDVAALNRSIERTTTFIWPVPVPIKSNSTFSAIMGVTLLCIPHSKNIFARTSLRFWRCGAKTIPSSCQPARKHSNAICHTLMCSSLIPATLPSRRTVTRSLRQSVISFRAPSDARYLVEIEICKVFR